MKEHIQAQMVNSLRDIARRYHNYGCLRELIRECVQKHLDADEEFRRTQYTGKNAPAFTTEGVYRLATSSEKENMGFHKGLSLVKASKGE